MHRDITQTGATLLATPTPRKQRPCGPKYSKLLVETPVLVPRVQCRRPSARLYLQLLVKVVLSKHLESPLKSSVQSAAPETEQYSVPVGHPVFEKWPQPSPFPHS